MSRKWSDFKKVTANAPDSQVINYIAGDVEKVGHVRHSPPQQKSDADINPVTAEKIKETIVWCIDDNVFVIINDCQAIRRS